MSDECPYLPDRREGPKSGESPGYDYDSTRVEPGEQAYLYHMWYEMTDESRTAAIEAGCEVLNQDFNEVMYTTSYVPDFYLLGEKLLLAFATGVQVNYAKHFSFDKCQVSTQAMLSEAVKAHEHTDEKAFCTASGGRIDEPPDEGPDDDVYCTYVLPNEERSQVKRSDEEGSDEAWSDEEWSDARQTFVCKTWDRFGTQEDILPSQRGFLQALWDRLRIHLRLQILDDAMRKTKRRTNWTPPGREADRWALIHQLAGLPFGKYDPGLQIKIADALINDKDLDTRCRFLLEDGDFSDELESHEYYPAEMCKSPVGNTREGQGACEYKTYADIDWSFGQRD